MVTDNKPMFVEGVCEHMVLSTYGGAKNVIIFGADLVGPLEFDAANKAVAQALRYFPHFVSSVQLTGSLGRKALVWQPEHDFTPELRPSDLELGNPEVPFEDAMLLALTPSLNKDWNLLQTMPTEFHLLRTSEKRHTFIGLVHHAAADGWTAAEFLKEWAAAYHEIITGSKPLWYRLAVVGNRSKRDRESLKQTLWEELRFFTKEYPNSRQGKQIFPEVGSRGICGSEHHVKTLLSPELTSTVLEIAENRRVAFVDLLVRAMNIALDTLNAERGVPPGITTTGLTVQMRKRHGPTDAPVNSSAVYFRSHPEERSHSVQFMRSLSAQRINQFRTKMDVKIASAAYTFSKFTRALPLRLRQRLVYSFLQHIPFNMQISLLGTGSPKFKRGRQSKDFSVTKPGALDVVEVHGIGHELAINIPLILWAGFYRNRLKLLLSAKGRYFDRAQSERFLSLVARLLPEDPFVS